MAEMKAASTRGKKFNQKIKPYVVLQYLLKLSIFWRNTAWRQSAVPSTATSRKSTKSP